MGCGFFHLDKVTIAWGIIIYGFIAAILPVWLLLAPRDYLSTFMKIGVIGHARGGHLVVAAPAIQSPRSASFARRATVRSSPARSSRSCSSRSPAVRCPGSTP